jgi:hypothetical protein
MPEPHGKMIGKSIRSFKREEAGTDIAGLFSGLYNSKSCE